MPVDECALLWPCYPVMNGDLKQVAPIGFNQWLNFEGLDLAAHAVEGILWRFGGLTPGY